MADYFLPAEIEKEILLRLPVDSLVKFSIVCKRWHFLITSSYFVSAHLSRSHSSATATTADSPYLLRRFTDPPRKQHFSLHFGVEFSGSSHKTFPFPFKSKRNLYFRIVGCLHGLICLSDDIFGFENGTIILWNPSVKRYVLLPEPALPDYAITFSTCLVSLALGFGFDSKVRDYKVVRLAYLRKDGKEQFPPCVEVYSLRNHSWKNIKASGVEFSVCDREWSQCFLNGSSHWIAYESKSGAVLSLIMLFDMEKERFKRMKLPEILIYTCPLALFVSDIRGLLGVLDYHFVGEVGERRPCCDVWVRKEYGLVKSWTKMYHVDVKVGVELVLSMRGNGTFLVATEEEELVSFDPKSRDIKNLGFKGIKESFYTQDFTESLVLFDRESHADSYGGIKQKENKKKMKEKSHSTNSKPQGSRDTKHILVSDGTNGNTNEPRAPARSILHQVKLANHRYQMERFRMGFLDE